MDYYNNNIYYYDQSEEGIFTLNTLDETFSSNMLIDCSAFQTFYNIQINSENQLIYLTDANGYVNSSTIRCYNFNGVYQYEFTSGLNTGKLIFKN